jgi:hypothetical protein
MILLQLRHEPRVRLRIRRALAHEAHRVSHRPPVRCHEISRDHRRGTRHALHAVYEDDLTALMEGFADEGRGAREVSGEFFEGSITNWDL